MPWVFLLPVATERHLPGNSWGLEVFRHLLLFLVAKFPVLGWNGLEVTPVASH